MVNVHQVEVTRKVLQMVGMDEGHDVVPFQKRARPNQKAKDKNNEQNALNPLINWTNSFLSSEDEPMRNISSGLLVPAAVSADM